MNLPSITKGLSTKSGSGDDGDLVSLESLLDRGRMEELDFDGRHITQIPFIEVKSDLDVSIQDSLNPVIRPEDITIVKKYLIEVIDTPANKVRTFVAALIPSKAFLDQYGADSLSYLHKGEFKGIVLYSNLDGSCRNVCFYREGPIRLGDVIDPGQKDLYSRVKVISLVRKNPETRSPSSDDDGIYGGAIAGSVCVAEKTTRKRVDEDDK
ncbi:MAG: hypothetical protein LKI42_03420 [Bacteroidales bacterium]|nr:hypothetical protein [Bacteroidales bacterium]MCI1785704.1 hypothetical protein [Bacteroidales bacterium]